MNLKKNPLINNSKHKFEATPFNLINKEHFVPALDYAIEQSEKKLDKIKGNPQTPTFENTILAIESSDELIEKISNIFFNLMSAESNNEFKELAQYISPKLSIHNNNKLLDSKLFKRIKNVYDNMDIKKLDKEKKRLVSEIYNDFVQNGALLNEDGKRKIRRIDEKLSKLSPKFSQNTLNSTNDYSYYTKLETDLDGLPEFAKVQAAETARSRNKKDGWLFTLQAPSMIPILQYSKNRKLRELISSEYGKIAFGGKFDNQNIIKEIVKLRYEKAQVLGFSDHSEYTLKKRMAGNTDTVMNFLNNLYDSYYPSALNELKELEALALKDGIKNIQPWDVAYYTEKLKKQRFGFDQEELRPYFKSENVIKGIFKVAQLMYGLKFKEVKDIPVYHKEVKTYEVYENNGEFLSLFYIDLHPRQTKRGGAWMTQFRSQGIYKGEMKRPHISIVCNLTPSTEKKPSLLSFSEVNTIFHEFGHALHGMLSNVTYSSLASPDVYWDFVELPSQIMENWLNEKETLRLFAFHYKTGEVIPDKLINKINESNGFNAGMFGLRQLSLGFLDMAWHTNKPENKIDIEQFENNAISKTQIVPKIGGTTISCHLGHIFSGGYSAGYYSYKWAEALDADAFELFKENGIFDKSTSNSFRKNILEKGNTEDPMKLYIKFRGKKPDHKALLRREKLINYIKE